MNLRLYGTVAAALLLVGCKDAKKTGGENAGSNPPATTSNQKTEMTTTPSGLKYQVLKQGTGTVSPKATNKVNVHYHGTLLDGTVFDSSVQRGQPISFPLNRVIA